MISVYDYDKNELQFEHKKNKFHLKMRGRIVCVEGKSAVGKTYIVELLNTIKRSKGSTGYDASNIITVDPASGYRFDIDEEILVIVDRAAFVLDNTICEKILTQKKTRYLIIARKIFNLNLSPNYFCELVNEHGVFSLQYRSNCQ